MIKNERIKDKHGLMVKEDCNDDSYALKKSNLVANLTPDRTVVEKILLKGSQGPP